MLALLSALFWAAVVAAQSSKTDFDFETLTLSSLKLLGDAHLNNGSVWLTRDLTVPNCGTGRVLYSKPVRFLAVGTQALASFSTIFSFSVNNLNSFSLSIWRLAFLISPDSSPWNTLIDVEYNKINGNQVGVDLNNIVSSEVGDLESVGIDSFFDSPSFFDSSSFFLL